MTRVWNITDGGQAGVKPHNRMVLGQNLKPGHYVQVDESRLAGATKVQRDVTAKLLHVGKQPPAWYAQKKKPARAVADGRKIGADGRAVGKRVAVIPGHAIPGPTEEEVVAVVTNGLPEETPEPAEEAQPVEAPAEETSSEETKEEESSSYGSRRRKRK